MGKYFRRNFQIVSIYMERNCKKEKTFDLMYSQRETIRRESRKKKANEI